MLRKIAIMFLALVAVSPYLAFGNQKAASKQKTATKKKISTTKNTTSKQKIILAEDWSVYVFNQPLEGKVLSVSGKFFAEKDLVSKALSLDPNIAYPEGSEITWKGKNYVWLNTSAKIANVSLMVNKETKIIDVTQFKGQAETEGEKKKGVGEPTVIIPAGGGNSGGGGGSFPSLPRSGY